MIESWIHAPLTALATFALVSIAIPPIAIIGGIILLGLVALLFLAVVLNYGALWFQAYMCGADISMTSLIGMTFRKVDPRMIMTAKIMGTQAGLSIDRTDGLTTESLEAHFLAGGDVMNVTRAIIAAQRAGIDLDFDRAAAIDLAGRDVRQRGTNKRVTQGD